MADSVQWLSQSDYSICISVQGSLHPLAARSQKYDVSLIIFKSFILKMHYFTYYCLVFIFKIHMTFTWFLKQLRFQKS